MSRQPEILRGATITGTGSYVPERVLTNADLERMVDTSDAWIVERTGIRERHIAAPGQASSDLALIAARRALEMAGLGPGDVDQLIVATVTPDRPLPSCACDLQAKLGATRAAAYDISAACSGFVFGLGVARSLIGASLADTILLVGVEELSRIADYEDRNTCVLFGDGAGAAVLRPCAAGEGILSVSVHSDGAHGDILEVPAGGSLSPATAATVARRDHFVKMHGRELFKLAVRGMEESMLAALERADLTAGDLELVIPHQANLRIIEATRERLGLPAEKMVTNIDRYGNTSAASIPISLDEQVRGGRLKPGDNVGMVAFGGGVTWGAAVTRWTLARQGSGAEATAVAHGVAS
jgi:3-oxoacyl-[acyl-carrier-protein] synthase III